MWCGNWSSQFHQKPETWRHISLEKVEIVLRERERELQKQKHAETCNTNSTPDELDVAI